MMHGMVWCGGWEEDGWEEGGVWGGGKRRRVGFKRLQDLVL